MSLFKKELLIGNSDETVGAIIEQLEKSNVPYEIGVKDILKQSSGRFRSKENDEVYELFYTIEVRKKYAEQVEAMISHYFTKQDIKQSYKLAKKESRKLERKENAIHFLEGLVLLITLKAIEFGKNEGVNIVSYIACSVLFMYGVFMTKKFYIELRNEKESRVLKLVILLMFLFCIGIMVYAVYAFLGILL